MQCEKCGSQMWDNRQGKRNPKAPDYKCKDKNCNHAVWLNSNQQYGVAQNNPSNVPAQQTSKSAQEILAKLTKIEDIVVKILQKTTGEIQYSETDMNPDKDLDIPF